MNATSISGVCGGGLITDEMSNTLYEIHNENLESGHLNALLGVEWGAGSEMTLVVFKCVSTWESQAGKGKVIVCLISTPPPGPGRPALARQASAVVHTRRGGRGRRRRGGGAYWEESGRPAAHAPLPSNKWAPQTEEV